MKKNWNTVYLYLLMANALYILIFLWLMYKTNS